MSKFLKAAVASSVLATSVIGANAAHAATAQADAVANILEQVSVASDGSDLDFATIIPPQTGDGTASVTVDAAGTRTACTNSAICSGATSAAGFTVSGATGLTVTIDADASVTLNSGGDSMTATLTESATTHVLTGVAATDVFSVGGTLSVPENQADGAYSGTFDVNVNYQ